uniref:(northern house mosquito) hypothetical protein n=1 Tax=Culex pipiens TaxID=7175 RepID=A0A8D7ZW52_CULPI
MSACGVRRSSADHRRSVEVYDHVGPGSGRAAAQVRSRARGHPPKCGVHRGRVRLSGLYPGLDAGHVRRERVRAAVRRRDEESVEPGAGQQDVRAVPEAADEGEALRCLRGGLKWGLVQYFTGCWSEFVKLV